MVACQRCKERFATALWGLYTKKGKMRRMHLCAQCGFSCHNWIRQFTPPDEPGSEPIFYRPYVRATILGPVDPSLTHSRASTKPVARARSVPLQGSGLDRALALLGVGKL